MPPDFPFRTMLDDRPVWAWPDGTTVPVVSGADGDEENGPASFAEALDAEDGPEPEPADDAPPPAAEAADEPERMVPWNEYVKLRTENADFRKRFQPYEQTFSRLEPDVGKALLEVAGLYADDPDRAAMELAAAFGIELPDDEEQPAGVTREDIRAEMASFFAEQQSTVAEAQAIQGQRDEIQKVAKANGFEPGTKEYRRLLGVARDEFSIDEFGEQVPAGDAVARAAQSLTSELSELEKKILAGFLEKKGQGGGVTVTGSGETPGTESPITDMDQASAAFKEFMRSA